MRKAVFTYRKTKAQIGCAVTVQLISVYIFILEIVQFLYSILYIRNFNRIAIFYGCKTRFISDVVENNEDRFSPDVG